MLFNSLAFPWYFFDVSGALLHSGSGSLFDIPSECLSVHHHEFYRSIRRGGWQKCHLGYATYCRFISVSESSIAIPGYLILPGLKVRGISSIQGKASGLTIYTEPSRIESHVEAVLETEGQLNERFDRLTRQNTHEIRGLNTGLYHAAEELKRLIKGAQSQSVRELELAKSITALSQILSVRLDLVNYLSDEDIAAEFDERIPIYKKFDKIRKCFIAQANKKKLNLQMRGRSRSHAYGPSNTVEIAAYLLIDNAIKYSPAGKNITVRVEDAPSCAVITIESIGPEIQQDEISRIFDMDFRSAEALKSGRPGSGIGLNVLKRLVVELFGGVVQARCGAPVARINNVQYNEIIFWIELPTTLL